MNDDKIFIQDFEGNSKKGLIFVDDDSDVIIEQDAPTSDTEVSSASTSERAPHPHPHKWRWIALSIFASVVFCFSVYAGWRLYNYYYNIGVPVSVTPEENIQKLAARHFRFHPGRSAQHVSSGKSASRNFPGRT